MRVLGSLKQQNDDPLNEARIDEAVLARDGRTARINHRGGSEPQRSPAKIPPSLMLHKLALPPPERSGFYT